MSFFMAKRWFIVCIVACIMYATDLAVAASMTSSGYVMLNDSSNCGGGKSTSTNYVLFDALCENAAGEQTGASTVLDSGFQAGKDVPFIDATLSGNALAFGTLSPTSVSTSAITITITTNANGGFNDNIIWSGQHLIEHHRPFTTHFVMSGLEQARSEISYLVELEHSSGTTQRRLKGH